MKKIPGLFLLLFILSACTQTPTISQSSNSATNAGTESSVSAKSGKIAFTEITVKPVELYDLLAEELPSAALTKIALETSVRYGFIYEAEALDQTNRREYEWRIHPATKEIIRQEESRSLDRETALTREQVEKITEIVDSVLAGAGTNARLDGWSAEVEAGRPILEVELAGISGSEKYFNLDTGALIRIDD